MHHRFDVYPNPPHSLIADTKFIPEVTAQNYIIVTVDYKQRRTTGKHAIESQLYRDHKATAFWLPKTFVNPGKKSDGAPPVEYRFQQAHLLFKWWPAIRRQAQTAKPSELFDVLDNGKIKRRP